MHAAKVALYRYGNADFDKTKPKAEYTGTLTVCGEIEYRITIEVTGNRLQNVESIPVILGVAIEEVK